jgi:hypothetical protein
MKNHIRAKALGNFGEALAATLLVETGFVAVRNLNCDSMNYPYGDLYAVKGGVNYIISVRTRNKLQRNGRLNSAYNFRKKSADVEAIAANLNATPAWLTIQIDVGAQRYWAYFGTMAELNVQGDRYSVSMSERATAEYICLAENRFHPLIRSDWDNRSY